MDVSEVKVLARRANGMLFVLPAFVLLSGFLFIYSILVWADVILPDKDLLCIMYLLSPLTGRHTSVSYFNSVWEEEFTTINTDFDKELFDSMRFGYIEGLDMSDINSYDVILLECVTGSAIVFLAFFIPFIVRLLTPRTIMEYDNYGIYIYRTGKPVTLIRYEELWSTYSEEDFENLVIYYRRGFYGTRRIRINKPFWGIFKTGSIRIEVPDDFINLNGIYHVTEVERELKRMVKKNRQEFIDEMEEKIKENQRQRELEELARHNPDT